ncbi:MAG: ATP-binding cassette domain-containing protein [Gemmataceae bacterium]
MIDLIDATKTYEQGRRVVHAVRGVSLTVCGGEFVSIMGPSGSGKSTLMHLMGALDTPTAGRAVFQGQDIQSMSDAQRSLLRRTRIGFVFQAFNLLPTLTAAENVALPLLLGGVPRKDAIGRATASLERVGLGHRGEHFLEEMSGGEMQRPRSLGACRRPGRGPVRRADRQPGLGQQPGDPVATGGPAGAGPAGGGDGHARPRRRPVRHPGGADQGRSGRSGRAGQLTPASA